jgi:hypothetical protein
VWRSPICPICGYKSEESPGPQAEPEQASKNDSAPRRSLISYLTAIPKLFWPKEKKYYWIIGLYKRKNS